MLHPYAEVHEVQSSVHSIGTGSSCTAGDTVATARPNRNSIQSTNNIVQTPMKTICTGLPVLVVWSQAYNTVRNIFALVNLLRQPVDEDEKRADRCNERKNDGIHGFLPSDR